MPGDISLEKFIETRFSDVDKQLADIKSALNYLSQNMVSSDRFESKMHSVKELRAMVDGQDTRIDKVEHFQSVIKYVGGLIVTVLVAIIIAWATGLI